MKFIVPNCSCLQNPWLGGTAPRSPFSLSSTEFVEPPPRTKFLGTPLLGHEVPYCPTAVMKTVFHPDKYLRSVRALKPSSKMFILSDLNYNWSMSCWSAVRFFIIRLHEDSWGASRVLYADLRTGIPRGTRDEGKWVIVADFLCALGTEKCCIRWKCKRDGVH